MAADLELRPGTVLIPDRAYAAAYTLRISGTDQSYVDLDDPTRLEFDYVQRMADALDASFDPHQPVRIVHVGGAGLTLPRYVTATRPGSAQVVLEPDAELTGFVRQYLPLPQRSGIKVRASDGRSGLSALRDDYADVVVLDAFDGARVPAELTTAEFLSVVRRVVGDAGTAIVNVTDRAPFGYAGRVLAGVVAAFGHAAMSAEPSTLKGRRFGNIILLGSERPLPLLDLARRAGSGAYPYRVLSGARLTQLLGGAKPFTDADSAMSPAPPGGLTGFA